MKDMKSAPFLREAVETAHNMYRLGWDERNSGNISLLLDDCEVSPYLDLSRANRLGRDDCLSRAGRVFPLGFKAEKLAGKLLLVTGAGQYFKNAKSAPERVFGLIRLSEDGAGAELLWGLEGGGACTSELPAHLMSHAARLEADSGSRVILHCHPTHLLALTHVHCLSEKALTRTLWGMCAECLPVFPDGVGVLPWMVYGTDAIGEATALKMRTFRLVLWAMHGVYAAGRSPDEAFGLVETAEKAAQVFLLTSRLPRVNRISDADLKALAKHLGIEYRSDFLGEAGRDDTAKF